MIHFVSGDILLTRAQVLVHGVAPSDPMTHGLAIPVYVYSEFHAGKMANEPGQVAPVAT